MMTVMNGKLKYTLGFYSLLFLLACNPLDYKDKTVGEVDFSKFHELLLSAESDSQIRKVDSFIFKVIQDSSIDRKIPQVWAEDGYGVKVNLSLLTNKAGLMVITSPYANWNSIDLAREVPESINVIEGEKRVICLLLNEKAPRGVEVPPDFYKVQLEQLSELFPNTYLIRQSEAKKLNLYSLPSRYYFDEKGVLRHISHTALSYNKLKSEIKQNLTN